MASMEIVWYHHSALSLVLLLIPFCYQVSSSNDCSPIPTCSDFQSKLVAQNDPELSTYKILNESEIARRGHMAGVVPKSYKLNFKFENSSGRDFPLSLSEGSAEIAFRLVHPVNRLLINQMSDTRPKIDYHSIRIESAKCPPTNSTTPPPPMQCIEKTIFLASNQTLILELRGPPLSTDIEYALVFPSFRYPYTNYYPDRYIVGVHEAWSRMDANPDSNASRSLTTIFQMRDARAVFPSFDQPALKARFQICLEYPSDGGFQSFSNTMLNESWTIVINSTNRTRDCFEPTPPMSTYLASFALVDDMYAIESIRRAAADGDDDEDGLMIELIADRSRIERYRWMLNESISVLGYMERITGMRFPLKRLAFILVDQFPYGGIENFGLISMYERDDRDTMRRVFIHEIVHQWLGNVVTIADWREICLQEGLTTYFHWKLLEDRGVGAMNVDEMAAEVRMRHWRASFSWGFANIEYASTGDMAYRCFEIPVFFFHALAKRYGFRVLERLLARLVQTRGFGSAGIDEWDEALAEVTDGEMRGYIKGWFNQPGPLTLLVSRIPNDTDDCILIRQKVLGIQEEPAIVRPVPLDIHVYDGRSPPSNSSTIQIVVSSSEDRICGLGTAPFIVDPETYTLTRKLYDVELYLNILDRRNASSIIDRAHLDNFVQEFCALLLDDAFPVVDLHENATADDWLEIYRLISLLGVRSGSYCALCMGVREDLYGWPQWDWDSFCKRLRINRILGRVSE